MTHPRQDTRAYTLKTPLGTDVLRCVSWTCTERVSSLFDLRIVVECDDLTVNLDKLLLQPVTLVCHKQVYAANDRFFSGIVRSVEKLPDASELSRGYMLHVVPPAWLLSVGRGYKVYQDKSVTDVLKDVLSPITTKFELHGLQQEEVSRTRFDESPWAFACRLMERYGIWYTFLHRDGECVMLLANSRASAVVRHRLETLEHNARTGTIAMYDAGISELRAKAGVFVHSTLVDTENIARFGRDDEKTAKGKPVKTLPFNNSMIDSSKFPKEFQSQLFEFVTGGGLDDVDKIGGKKNDVSKLSVVLQEQADVHAQRAMVGALAVTGSSVAPSLLPGAKVQVDSKVDPTFNGDYFVVSVHHEGANNSQIGGDGQEGFDENSFEFLPHVVEFRPPLVTPWPSVSGMHVATVVGPTAEEIFTDKYGRVRVVFPWNRDGSAPNGPGDSCWVRVAQMVAGKGWGTFFLPRVGQEVLVSFLGGDPDQPVVVGSLYNDTNLPQIKLPDKKTQSAIRTRSTPNGNADNYNELRFDDKKDSEEVHFQAERDFIGVIKNDSTLTVKKGNQEVTLEEGNQTIKISEGTSTLSAKKDVSLKSESAKMSLMAKQDVTLKSESAKMDIGANANITITSQTGKIEVSAVQSIELKCGPSSIKISPSGVEISGLQLKASGSVQAEVSAGAMLTLKGGVVMIN